MEEEITLKKIKTHIRRISDPSIDFMKKFSTSKNDYMIKYLHQIIPDSPSYNLYYATTCLLNKDESKSFVKFFHKNGFSEITISIINNMIKNEYYKDLYNLISNLDILTIKENKNFIYIKEYGSKLSFILNNYEQDLKERITKWKPLGEFKKMAYEQRSYMIFKKMKKVIYDFFYKIKLDLVLMKPKELKLQKNSSIDYKQDTKYSFQKK